MTQDTLTGSKGESDADLPVEHQVRGLFEMARAHVDSPAPSGEMNRTWTRIWGATQLRRKPRRMRWAFPIVGLLLAGGAMAFFGRDKVGLDSPVVRESPIAQNGNDPTPDTLRAASGRASGEGEPSACSTHYVDPMQMLALGPNERSAAYQPWRAWLETVPASRLIEAPGVTLGDNPTDETSARLIAAAGFRHARVEIGWDHVQADDDTRMKAKQLGQHTATLEALRRAGVRPTILLTGVVGGSPTEKTVVLSRPAVVGDRKIWLTPSTATQVRPGRTRLRDADSTIMVTIDADGGAVLSRPLSRDLAAGVPYTALVTRYAPFRRPTLTDGSRDPIFDETIEGWRRFVRTALRMTRGILGDDGFDLEIWNLYRGASDFFDVEKYFDPVPSDLGPGGPEAAAAGVVAATVDVVRAAGLTGVRIANGFANRTWVSDGVVRLAGVDGVSAVGRHVNAWDQSVTADKSPYHFPEVGLTALGDQPLFRDLSPLRVVGAESALSPGQKVWLTSLSLGVRFRRAEIPDNQIGRYKAVMALRGLAAYAHKGAQRVMFYQQTPEESFIGGPKTGGPEVREALARFLTPFRSPSVITTPVQVTLETFDSCPTPQNVSPGLGGTGLWNGELFAFFPFQVSDRRVAAVVYVMSHDPARSVVDPTTFPPVRFGLQLGGLPPDTRVSLVDPLSAAGLADDSVSSHALQGGLIHVDVQVTDAPRILLLDLP